MRDKGERGYIDVAVMVLCVMLVIALGVRLFPIFITKMQVDNFADELAREAESQRKGRKRDFEQAESLGGRTGIHPTVQWSRTGNLQLNEEGNGYRYHTKGLRVVWKLWFVSKITIRAKPPERVGVLEMREVKKKTAALLKDRKEI